MQSYLKCDVGNSIFLGDISELAEKGNSSLLCNCSGLIVGGWWMGVQRLVARWSGELIFLGCTRHIFLRLTLTHIITGTSAYGRTSRKKM